MKQRKQIRVYDLYRMAIIGKASKIRGIRHYSCNDDVTRVYIIFDSPHTTPWVFRCKDEQDHKNLIRCVNKMAHFIEIGHEDTALAEYNDYNREYNRRYANED